MSERMSKGEIVLKELHVDKNVRQVVVIAVSICTVVMAVGASFLGYSVYKWRTSLFFGLVPEGISMSSSTEGWVVGMRERFILSRPSDVGAPAEMAQSSSDESTVALHLHNGLWSRVRVPVAMFGVFTVSADDAWASSPLHGLYHWDGKTWSKVPGTETIGGISSGWGGISMLSPSDGWAVSWGRIWHYTLGEWIDARNLLAEDSRDATLFSISMVSANDGWAVGLRGVILHYDGKLWKKVESPVSARDPHQAVDLKAVSMVSADEGWAIGTWDLGGHERSVILHYVGGKWTITYDNLDASLKTVAMVSPTEGWAAGTMTRSVTVGNVTTLNVGGTMLHYHDGRWTSARVPGNEDIIELSMGSPDDGWALTYDGLLHYHDGVWEQFSQ